MFIKQAAVVRLELQIDLQYLAKLLGCLHLLGWLPSWLLSLPLLALLLLRLLRL